MELQTNIKYLCKRRGITLQALANAMGVTYGTLFNQAKNNPSLSSLERIANALNCEVWELLKPIESNQDTTKENALICPHCGKPLHIEVTK